MALGVAVVGVDADDLRRPGALRGGDGNRVAQLHLQASRQLFAEHQAVVLQQAVPGRVHRLQQRPVLTISGVVDHAEHLRGPALQLHRHLPRGQYGLHQGLAGQPRRQLLGLLRILRVEVQLGGEALLQPMGEGLAKARGHGAGADIRRQGQQQRHQRQAQGRQLLAAIGQEPLAQYRATTPQHGFQ